MTPAKVSQITPRRLSVVSVPLTPTQVMTIIESLRMAKAEVLKAKAQVEHIYPESVMHAEQLARYAELMADTAEYLDKVHL